MSEPLVVAICLTKNRPQMLRRAVASFRSQTYENKSLLVLDSGTVAPPVDWLPNEVYAEWHQCEGRDRTIGYLRNFAVELAKGADIIVTWDDDDRSSPERIAGQVAFLQRSGAQAVGYSDLLFWRTTSTPGQTGDASAWRYVKPKLAPPPGTTLCYWRETWDARHFPSKDSGEDWMFCQGRDVRSEGMDVDNPLMIASIHGGNTNAGAYRIEELIAWGSREWRRVPEWDKYCRAKMALPIEVSA